MDAFGLFLRWLSKAHALPLMECLLEMELISGSIDSVESSTQTAGETMPFSRIKILAGFFTDTRWWLVACGKSSVISAEV